MKPKVLEEDSAIEWVEYVIRVASLHGCARVVCTSRDRAQVVGDVAADWLRRLLGEVRVLHVTQGHLTEDEVAVCSVCSSALVCVYCGQAIA
jgi:hypothetical protein